MRHSFRPAPRRQQQQQQQLCGEMCRAANKPPKLRRCYVTPSTDDRAPSLALPSGGRMVPVIVAVMAGG
jgi:hypothetical protein